MGIIQINDFAPVKEAKIDLKNRFQILIGPQASGKSTVCRVVYFCRKIRDYSLDYLMDPELLQQSHKNEVLTNYFNNILKSTTKALSSVIIKGFISIELISGKSNEIF